MWKEQKIRLPVTLVNEYNSSMEAKAKVAEIVQKQILLETNKLLAEKSKVIKGITDDSIDEDEI